MNVSSKVFDRREGLVFVFVFLEVLNVGSTAMSAGSGLSGGRERWWA